MMLGSRRWAIAIVIVIASPLVLIDVQAQPSQVVEWWGSTDPLDGHHIRIPATVSNPIDSGYTMDRPPVAFEIDLAEVLADAGWATVKQGDSHVLQSFELDLNSIRVVAMTNLESPTTGTTNGRLRVVDAEAQGLERYVVPSKTLQGFLLSESKGVFDAQTNPIITVLWQADKDIDPGESLHYMVYLDSTLYGNHLPPQVDPLADAFLDGLYGPGPSRQLYGYMPEQGKATIGIMSLHPDTEVTLFTKNTGGSFAPRESFGAFENPFQVPQGDPVSVVVGSGSDVVFKLEANKPILAFKESLAFVPGEHGGYADDSFTFFSTGSANRIYFTNAGTEETVVRVDGNPAFDYHLTDDQNPLPYTTSPYAEGAGADCSPDNPRMPGLVGAGLHRAEVIQGGPVLLQVVGNSGTVGETMQIPAINGGHVGDSFYAVMGQEDTSTECKRSDITAKWYATAIQNDAGIRLMSPETPRQIFPSGTPATPFPEPMALSQQPVVDGPYGQVGTIRERPIRFDSVHGDVRLFTGFSDGGRRELVGPLLGSSFSTSFVGMSPSIIISPHDGNTVTPTMLHASGMSKATLEISQEGTVFVEDGPGGQDPLSSFSVQSTKPVFIYPTGTNPGYLAGIPPYAEVTQDGGAEFRGHLLVLETENKIDRVVKSTTAGVGAKYALTVQNLGRTFEGTLQTDNVEIQVTKPKTLQGTAAEGWEVEWTPRSIPLFDTEPQDIDVTVTPPKDAKPFDTVVVSVVARSEGNPNVAMDVDLVTYLKRSFDVGLWFDYPESTIKFQEQTITPGTDAVYSVAVKNQGTVADRIFFEVDSGQRGWTTAFVDEQGSFIDELEMEPGENRSMKLIVSPPDKTEDVLDTVIKAVSFNEPAAFEQITAFTKLRLPTEINLETAYLSDLALPGEEALFPMTLSNVGQSGVEVEFDLLMVAPDGWDAPTLFAVNPADGSRVILGDHLTLRAGQNETITVALRVPEGALAKEIADIRFAVSKTTGGDALEAFFAAVVDNQHALSVSTDGLPRKVSALPSNQSLILEVENEGNVDEFIQLRLRQGPPGWSAHFPASEVIIPMGDKQSIPLSIQIPAGAPAGDREVVIALQSSDGDVTSFHASFEVEAINSIAVHLPDAIEVQPGEQLTIDIPVTNTGNTRSTVAAAPTGDTRWTTESSAPIHLKPLENGNLRMQWTVPAVIANGESPQSISVLSKAQEEGASNALEELELNFAVGRPEIRPLEATTRDAPGGTLVEVSVQNDGNRPARQVQVALQVGDEVVDKVSIEELKPNQRAPVSLLVPLDAGRGQIRVVVDGVGDIVEVNEDNNVLNVDSFGQTKDTSTLPLLTTLFGVVLAAVVHGRRRIKE